MRDIVNIHFSRLTILQVWANEIESVEQIARVDMPHLQQLYLSICGRM